MSASFLRNALLFAALIVATIGTPANGTQPLASRIIDAGLGSPLELAGFSTTGQIWQINREASNVGFFSDKPFWGPPHYGADLIVLWPAGTWFVLHIAAVAPITIDGAKAGYNQLAVGQTVNVQYSIMRTGGMYCAARRIDAHSAPPAKNRTSHKHQ